MPTEIITTAGDTYEVPLPGESNYGDEVHNLLVDLGTNALLKNGAVTTSQLVLPTSGTVTSLTAGSVMNVGTRTVHMVQSASGAITLNSTTPLNNSSTDGFVVILIGRSATNTVTIPDSGNVDLNGSITLGANTSITLIWMNAIGKWVELNRNI